MAETAAEQAATAKRDRVFLVVVDDSTERDLALKYACLRARNGGGRVALLRVIEPVGMVEWAGVGVLMADIGTGLYAAQSLATALYHRLAHKEGSHIQVSLFESCAAFQGMNFLEQAMAGARPFGAVSAPNGVFHTSDGRLTIVVLNNAQFARMCRALERGAWAEEPRFADNAARMRHKDDLHGEIAAPLQTHSTD